VRLPVPICRLGYRTAYTALRGWWFVRRPEVKGVKCVLTDGDSVLLVRHTYGRREWDLPGGTVKRDEEPLNAARREMLEELGVSVQEWVALGQLSARMDHRRDNMHCFQAELGAPEITMDPCELAQVQWFPRAQLPPDLGRYVRPILGRTGG
jgi:8-oxo-dGTP pyrophosphatase MutT (NUDIX family)